MKSSILIAVFIFGGLAVWLLSGWIWRDVVGAGRRPAEISEIPGRTLMAVGVRLLEAQPVVRRVRFSGQTEPARSVLLRTETAGLVEAVSADRGVLLEEDAEVIRLRIDDRAARLAQAEALAVQRELELVAAERLAERGFQAETARAQAKAASAQAEAVVEAMTLDIERTAIRTPFRGYLQERLVEVGDYVGIGDVVAHLHELEPLIVAGHVTESEVAGLRQGMEGTARMRSGELVPGRVRYVAPSGDQRSRTFRVELELENPGGRYRAGMTCEVEIPVGTVLAHRVSPAVLALDEEGAPGIKAVGSDDRVVFYAVEVVESRADAIWLTGMPETVRMITTGQGFTRPGDKVAPVWETPLPDFPVPLPEHGSSRQGVREDGR